MWNHFGVSICSQYQFTQNRWRSEELIDAGIRTASEQCCKEEVEQDCRGKNKRKASLRVYETGRCMMKRENGDEKREIRESSCGGGKFSENFSTSFFRLKHRFIDFRPNTFACKFSSKEK
jgi:hypothetical protein